MMHLEKNIGRVSFPFRGVGLSETEYTFISQIDALVKVFFQWTVHSASAKSAQLSEFKKIQE